MDPTSAINATAAISAANPDPNAAIMQQAMLTVGVIAILTVGILIGRLLDLDWRCTKMRQFLKKNYVVLNILEGDGAVYLSSIVNLENDVLNVDNKAWVIDKRRIYRRDKPALGSIIGKQDIKWGNQGAPNIFVGKDDLKAKPLDDPNKSILKPTEVGSALNGWKLYEAAKAKLAALKDNLPIYLGVMVLIMLAGFYVLHGENADLAKQMNGIQNGSISVACQAGAAHAAAPPAVQPPSQPPTNINKG